MIYNQPQYNLASKKAIEFLYECKVDDFPYNLKKCAQKYGVKLVKYSTLIKTTDCTLDDLIMTYDTEEGCLIYDSNNEVYTIVYNDLITSFQRKRFTIAHELGHYVMGHLTDNRTIIYRNNLSKREHDNLEKEANRFARDILAPPYLVNRHHSKDPEHISWYFEVSYTAAKNVLNFLEYKNFDIEYPKMLINQFERFLYDLNNLKCCARCEGFTYSSTYCQLCGHSKLVNLIAKVDWELKYDQVEVTENGRMIRCSNCENEIIQDNANFCTICGIPVVNRCSQGHDYYEEYPLPGHARYCDECGAESTFMQNKILRSYDEVRRERIEKAKLEHANRITSISNH